MLPGTTRSVTFLTVRDCWMVLQRGCSCRQAAASLPPGWVALAGKAPETSPVHLTTLRLFLTVEVECHGSEGHSHRGQLCRLAAEWPWTGQSLRLRVLIWKMGIITEHLPQRALVSVL